MRQNSVPVIIASILATAIVIGGIAIMLNLGKPSRTADADPVVHTQPSDTSSWTHKELLEHLKRRGVEYYWINDGQSKIAMCKKGTNEELLQGDDQFLRAVRGLTPANFGYISVSLHQSVQVAREKAGSTPDSRSWGRFVFVGKESEIAKIISLLPKPQS